MPTARENCTSPASPAAQVDTVRPHSSSTPSIVPGVALAGAVAALAFLAHYIPGLTAFSPMILAIVIGIAFRNIVGTPSRARPGMVFSLKRLLRAAIVLLGFQITFAQVATVGTRGLLIVAATLIATFVFTVYAGRLLGVDRKLTELIAAGTSICGASAIIATNTVTGAREEDIAYAVACITLFGSIAMFAYPFLPGVLHLDPQTYGLWSGASIHEIAQVTAASFQNGQHAGEIATVVKLGRVSLLAPVVLTLGLMARRSAGDTSIKAAQPPLPWFVLGFVALVGVNSVVAIPDESRKMLVMLTTFLLTIALAAMGLETDISRLYARGIRPAILGALAFLFIASFCLTLIKLTG